MKTGKTKEQEKPVLTKEQEKALLERRNEQKALKSIDALTTARPQPSKYCTELEAKVKQGLLCPNRACRSQHSRVTKTMPKGNIVVRYRECEKCGTAWSTEEKAREGNS